MTYTGITHVHSTYSYDGKLSLAELKALLVGEGIHFACMSEHTDELSAQKAEEFVTECRQLSDEKFVFVPGFEVPYQRAHILLFGTDVFLTQISDMDSLGTWSKQAALTILAHPVRNHFKLDEVMRRLISGVEVWNQQYDGKWVPRTRSIKLLKELRKDRPSLLATGGVDFHRREHLGAPHIKLETASLSEAAIIASLKAGQFSFGSDTLQIQATAKWRPSLLVRLKSLVAVSVITTGKWVNKTLARFGVALPTSVRQQIRKRF